MEPQNPMTDPASLTTLNHQPEQLLLDELKDETMKKKMKKKIELKEKKKEIMNKDEASHSSCLSSTSNTNSTSRVSRVALRLRNPKVRLGLARRSFGERQAEALALPLAMSFAAFANLVLERMNVAGQNVSVDDLAIISTSAVKESLANVYGDKLGSFATNFEKSFKSTLKILRLINESALPHNIGVAGFNSDRSTIECCSDNELSATETSSATSGYESIQGGARTMNEIVMHEGTRELSAFPRSSGVYLTTIEQSLEEQARANDLKSMEIALAMEKLRLKEAELALRYESNNLETAKLEMNVAKAAFREEKFKIESEYTQKTDMANRIMDWQCLSVVLMLAALACGASAFSQGNIKAATSICEPSDEKSDTWWFLKQVSWVNILICQLWVWVQSLLGLFLIVFAAFLIQRSSSTKPVTFIVVFLGIVVGIVGKFAVDTLGGNSKLWLILWESFCLLQLVANFFTLALYGLIYGPIQRTTKSSRCNAMVPYWARQGFFYGVIMSALPVITGLLPFATLGQWINYLSELVWGSSLSQIPS